MAPAKGTTFQVALGDIKLSAEQKKQVSAAINGAALHELARLDLADGVHAGVPKEGLGIWIDRLKKGAVATVPDTAPAVPIAEATTSFLVSLGSLKLSAAQKTGFSTAIRSAALQQIGQMGVGDHISIRYPKEWLGIWIERVPKVGGPGGIQ